MSNILLNHISTKTTSYNGATSNNRIISSIMKYPIKITNNEMFTKLPKIKKNILTENNRSVEENYQIKNEETFNDFKINIHSYRNTKFNKNHLSKIKIINSILKNKELSNLNNSFKPSIKMLKNSNKSLLSEPNNIKDLLNKSKRENRSNFSEINNFYQNLEKNQERVKKKRIINEYVSILLNENNNQNNPLFPLFNNEKKEKKIKYSLDKSIDPTKYIKNKFLDESYNKDDFKTSKIQIDSFNGNEYLRKINFKRINANNMNH